MERLRYVARAGTVPMVPLVREAAAALVFFADDPMSLLTACRRLLDRRGDCGPLVWLAARMLTGLDPRQEARAAVAALEDDPTVEVLDGEFAFGAAVLAVGYSEAVASVLDGRPDLRRLDPADPDSASGADCVLFGSDCLGPSEALVDAEAVCAAEAAHASEVPVWLVAGVGRALPERMWELLSSARHRPGDPALGGLEVLDIGRFVTRVATPAGLRSPADAARQSDCPVVPEIFTP